MSEKKSGGGIVFEDSPDNLDKLINQHSTRKAILEKAKEDLTVEVQTQSAKAKPAPIQSTIDLHGMNRREARMALEEFLLSSHKKGLRRLLVVTGKGYNSPNRVSVLRSETAKILEEDPYGIVAGFAPAAQKHGGTGAFDVKLK